jgi:hypothetical protein
VSILGRILFAAKSEPAIDRSEIESRLQEISTPVRLSDLPVEPSATLAHDPAVADDPLVNSEPSITNHPHPPITSSPVMNPGEPLEMLSQLAAVLSNRSQNLLHQSDCGEAS